LSVPSLRLKQQHRTKGVRARSGRSRISLALHPGYWLIGGRLHYINGRPVAALVYRYAKHDINLFVWPGESAGAALETRNGYNLVSWTADGMASHAVSDLNSTELERFARLR
jgi:anti-sigma factor RsiW